MINTRELGLALSPSKRNRQLATIDVKVEFMVVVACLHGKR